jgi:hypothetical protein
MATLLNGTDTNRLVEVLAGSTALLNDTNGSSALPLSLNALLGDDTASADVTANAATPAAADGPLVTAGLLDPVTDVVDGVLGTDTSNLLGVGDVLNLGTPSQLALAGDAGGAQPVFDATNILIKDVHAEIETLSHQSGLSDILHAVTNLGETTGLGTTGAVPPAVDDGHTNLVTDIVNAPSTLLNGGLDDVIAHVGADLGDTLDAAVGVVGAILNGSDPLNPIPELLNGLTSSLQNLPLLNINGGDSADGGGLLGGLGGGLLNGVVGDVTGSSTGHLIDIDLGPENGNGLGLDLLATPDATHSASINVLDVGPNGPQLLDLGLLTGDGLLDLGGNGDTGLGGLTGNLLGSDGLVGNLLGGTGLGGVLGGADAGGPLASTGLGDGLLNGVVGNLTGSSTGHLIDVDAGPQDSNGLGLDLLATPGSDATHTASVNAVDVGPNGPQLLDLSALTGGSGILDIPSLGGAGADGLTGNLLGPDGLVGGLLSGHALGGGLLNGDIASGNTTSAPITAPIDIAALTDHIAAPLTGDHGILDLHGAHIL